MLFKIKGYERLSFSVLLNGVAGLYYDVVALHQGIVSLHCAIVRLHRGIVGLQ